MASNDAHVAGSRAGMAEAPFGWAVSDLDDTDTVIAPCRTAEGIVFVPVPRRTVLASGLAGLATAALPTAPAMAMPILPEAGGSSPVERFAQLRRVLIQSDNLMGARHVLSAVQQNLHLLDAHRKVARGHDTVRLLELKTRYEELVGRLAQDIGDERVVRPHGPGAG
ncbi:hypothetical protein [Streptomyces sp. NBC_00057]|uniref:hypothetical protein n=1 Tax=Streptomyces sp. NBC_00057 TaxID=2975634 RepID=UPI003253B04D